MMYLLLKMKRFCGFVTGFVFFLSGIVKLMDPVGAGLVMKEYYDFLHIGFMEFSAKAAGTFFALAETVIGAALITGVWRRTVAQIAIALQGMFTVLTLLLVIFKPEMDCGCFGEAIHLTHGQTFVKNIILLALLLTYYFPRKHLGETRKKKYVSFAVITASAMAFMVYSWMYIPMVDYTAYKPGAELQDGAMIDADEVYESVFIYEKDGIKEEFSLESLPDSTWTFVSTETKMTGKPQETADLSFYSATTGEYCDSLALEGNVIIVSVYDKDMSSKRWARIESFASKAEDAGFMTLILCAMHEEIPESVADKAYISDYKTLISLNRSNGGVTYFHDGQLIKKWARRNSPDAEELKAIINSDATEICIEEQSKGSLAFQGFLLYVFAVMLLL